MSLVELVADDVEQATEYFEQFHQRFASDFATKTRSMSTEAKQYLQGQLTCQERGNLWVFEKTVPYAKSQSLQHFISNSPWTDKPILDSITQTVKSRIGDATRGSIHIDESGFAKDGNNSVGVARQYCGRLGKVDNCQVGVFLGYATASHRLLLDRRLYLPQEWIDDSQRREKCGVPEEIEFQTKAQLGLELIRIAQQRDLPYAWVGFDCHYGQQPWLLKTLEQEGQTYIADLPVTTGVWLTPPLVHVPKRAGNRGRIPTQPKVAEGQPTPIQVTALPQQLDEAQ